MDLPLDLQRRLLYILERSYVELGLLTLQGKSKQAYDLTQAVENIPRHLLRWNERSLAETIRDLGAYKEQYAPNFDYLQVLDPSYCSGEDLLD